MVERIADNHRGVAQIRLPKSAYLAGLFLVENSSKIYTAASHRPQAVGLKKEHVCPVLRDAGYSFASLQHLGM